MVSGAKKLSYLMAMVITGAIMIMPVAQAAEAEDDLNSFTIVNVNEKVYHRGCGQKPGLSIIPGGIACFPMKRELKPLTYSYSTI